MFEIKEKRIIGLELEKFIREKSHGYEIALVLWYGNNLVHDSFSTHKLKIETYDQYVFYNGISYPAKKIAEWASKEDENLNEIPRYQIYDSDDKLYHLFIASDVKGKSLLNIAFSIDNAWKENFGYNLGLSLAREFIHGKICYHMKK